MRSLINNIQCYGVIGYAEIPEQLYPIIEHLYIRAAHMEAQVEGQKANVIKALQSCPMKLGHEVLCYTITVDGKVISFYLVEKKNTTTLYLDFDILLKSLGCNVSDEIEALDINFDENKWDVSAYNEGENFDWDSFKDFLLRTIKATNK